MGFLISVSYTHLIQFVIDALTDAETGVVKSLEEINAVGHRVVHGGENFSKSVVVTPEVKKAIEECNDLAPVSYTHLDVYKRQEECEPEGIVLIHIEDSGNSYGPPFSFVFGKWRIAKIAVIFIGKKVRNVTGRLFLSKSPFTAVS